METHRKQLLKLFSSSLRNRANGTSESLNPQLLRYLTRKDLIAIIKKMNNGNIPKDIDLVEMENEALLNLIGNDLYIISYMIERWTQELVKEPKSQAPVKPKKNEKVTQIPKQTKSN